MGRLTDQTQQGREHAPAFTEHQPQQYSHKVLILRLAEVATVLFDKVTQAFIQAYNRNWHRTPPVVSRWFLSPLSYHMVSFLATPLPKSANIEIKTQLLIVQPTPFCNINCRYCYLPDRANRKRMDIKTVSQIFQRFFTSRFVNSQVTVVWHAGEPLVLPISYYAEAFENIERLNRDNYERVREVPPIIGQIVNGSLPLRSQTNVPMAILCFDCYGNVSTFSPELLTMKHARYGNFLIGNVFENSLEEMLSSPRFMFINDQVQRGVMACKKTCDYYEFCGGGSPSNKVSENGDLCSTETQACRLQVMAVVDAVLEHFEGKFDLF